MLTFFVCFGFSLEFFFSSEYSRFSHNFQIMLETLLSAQYRSDVLNNWRISNHFLLWMLSWGRLNLYLLRRILGLLERLIHRWFHCHGMILTFCQFWCWSFNLGAEDGICGHITLIGVNHLDQGVATLNRRISTLIIIIPTAHRPDYNRLSQHWHLLLLLRQVSVDSLPSAASLGSDTIILTCNFLGYLFYRPSWSALLLIHIMQGGNDKALRLLLK